VGLEDFLTTWIFDISINWVAEDGQQGFYLNMNEWENEDPFYKRFQSWALDSKNIQAFDLDFLYKGVWTKKELTFLRYIPSQEAKDEMEETSGSVLMIF